MFIPQRKLSAHNFKKGLLIGGCLFFGGALASGETISPMAFPTMPGISLYGLGGNGWTAIGDVMAPVVGQPTSFFFLDPQIYYHSPHSEYTGSLGGGGRWLTPSSGILGAYVFGDYNHSNDGNSFWFVSPGIERLGPTFDFSANAYIPVSNQRINNGLEFADQAGDFSQVTFSGHTQFDELVNTFESVGWGGDVQVGARLPFRNTKLYLGGYYFDPKDSSSILGGAVRAEIPVNNYVSVMMSEAYDGQYHNTLKAGLTLWFGGRRTGYDFTGNLADRMVDPIQRNLIAVAGGAHNAQPVVDEVENTGQTAVEMTNISFFVPETGPDDTAVQGDGTYENPYVGMSQYNVDDANDQNNRNFYIDSGTYNATYSPLVNPDFIVLNNDQLYGRTSHFTRAAYGSLRPVINFTDGGFLVPGGDTSDSFNGLQLFGDGLSETAGVSGTAGIFVDHESGPAVQVSVFNSSIQNFGDGIDIYNTVASSTELDISYSMIANNFGGGVTQLAGGSNGGYGGGVAALNEGAGGMTLNILHSQVSNNFNGQNLLNWAGILLFDNGSGNAALNANYVTVDNNNNNLFAILGGGIFVDNEGTGALTALINHSQVEGNTFNGIEALDDTFTMNTNSLNLTVKNSTISNNTNGGAGIAFGVLGANPTNSDLTALIQNNTLTGNSVGIYLQNNMNSNDFSVMINHDYISDSGVGIVIGAASNSGNTVIDVNSSTITGSNDDGIKATNNKSTGAFTLNVNHSTISDNFNNGINFSDNNSSGVTTLNVGGSKIIDNGDSGINAVALDSDSNAQPTNLTVMIDRSFISGNFRGISLVADASDTGTAASAQISTTVSNSVINNNQVGILNIAISIAGSTTATATSNLTVKNSVIAHNDTGIASLANSQNLGGNATSVSTVNLDQSIVFDNKVALDSFTAGGAGSETATINVINPIFFDGVVNFSGAGASVNIPGVPGLNSGDHVVCNWISGCTVVP